MEPCNICGEPADGGLHVDSSVCAEYLRQRVAELEAAGWELLDCIYGGDRGEVAPIETFTPERKEIAHRFLELFGDNHAAQHPQRGAGVRG